MLPKNLKTNSFDDSKLEHLLLRSYKAYQTTFAKTPNCCPLAGYGWTTHPTSLSFEWLPYTEMLNEFAPALANAINQLIRYERTLRAWHSVTQPLGDSQKLELIIEFIEPVQTVALLLPYAIKNRFVYATAHLCHQANRAILSDGWTDNFPNDEDINFDTADNYARYWNTYNSLKRRIEKINSKKFQNTTGDFRNLFTHRSPVGLEIGLSGFVKRRQVKGEKKTKYHFGSTYPLKLQSTVEQISEQCKLSIEAYNSFKRLIGQHEETIRNHNSNSD